MNKLIIMTGLPGTGKSSLAKALAEDGRYTVLSADPIEAALHRSGIDRDLNSQKAAYEAMFAVADTQLSLGGSVIIDAVNPREEVRQQWLELGDKYQTKVYMVHCVCSDEQTHQERISSRNRNIPGFKYEPQWHHVKERIDAQDVSEPTRADIKLDCLNPLLENVQRLKGLVG